MSRVVAQNIRTVRTIQSCRCVIKLGSTGFAWLELMDVLVLLDLGMWIEVAASNEDAYEASVSWQERTGRPLHMRDYHTLDWLLDAYLRLDRLEAAKRVMDELD